MHTKSSKEIYTYLEKKYNSMVIGKAFVAHEMDIELSTLDLRISSNMQLPPYIKIGNKSNSKVVTNLHDLAYYLASDTVGSLSSKERELYIYEYLTKKYPRILIGKKSFSSELRVSNNTLGEYMKKGYTPRFKKHGTAHNSKITFNLADVSKWASTVTKTM